MSVLDRGTLPENGFRVVWEELKRRTKKPRSQVVYWTYFVGSVCIIGGIGTIIEIVRYIYAGTSQDMSGIYLSMTTFFPALIGSSAMQIMFEAAPDRRMQAVSISALILTLGMAVFLIASSNNITLFTWSLVALSCSFALWVWWISNADNPGLYDVPPIDAATGGSNPNIKLQGDTSGIQL